MNVWTYFPLLSITASITTTKLVPFRTAVLEEVQFFLSDISYTLTHHFPLHHTSYFTPVPSFCFNPGSRSRLAEADHQVIVGGGNVI